MRVKNPRPQAPGDGMREQRSDGVLASVGHDGLQTTCYRIDVTTGDDDDVPE